MEKIITSNNSDALNFFKTTERVFIMFSKIKQGFDRKAKRLVALILAASMLCGIAGCSKETNGSPTESNDTSAVLSNNNDEIGFDIDRVRKNIIIKGQTIEIPVKLGEIPEGWSYKLYDEKDVYLRENQFLATMYYNGNEMYIAALENFFPDKPKESIIYNLTIETDDCSIDGLVPLKSTKQEVVKRYGEPVPKVSDDDYYFYGIVNGESKVGGRLNDHSIGVRFTEDNLIKSISITYADLSVNY
jgi:hypothetical protein|nr:MAG TPA: putative peptidyl-prolyl cis-trans isomerase [Caudoviricetes sp.]